MFKLYIAYNIEKSLSIYCILQRFAFVSTIIKLVQSEVDYTTLGFIYIHFKPLHIRAIRSFFVSTFLLPFGKLKLEGDTSHALVLSCHYIGNAYRHMAHVTERAIVLYIYTYRERAIRLGESVSLSLAM